MLRRLSAVIYTAWLMHRSNTRGGHILLSMVWQKLDNNDNSDNVKQAIETLERERRISQDVIKDNLDRKHPIGQPDEYGKQLRIAKFKTDSFKGMVLRKHKHRRNLCIEKQKRSGKPVQIKVKLQPSLRRHRIGLLKFNNSQFARAKISNLLMQICTVP